MKVDAVKLEVKELKEEFNLLESKISTLLESMELGPPYHRVQPSPESMFPYLDEENDEAHPRGYEPFNSNQH